MDGMPSLHSVLHATVAELAELAVMTDDIGGARLGEPEQWQRLDFVSQRLAGLGAFLDALVLEVPDCNPELSRALATVRLSALVNRLVGKPENASAESGDFELFGS